MYDDFQDRAEFFLVYIAEAHTIDGWQTESNETEGIRISQHETMDERLAATQLCADKLALTIPVLVDGMNNEALGEFSAWPERIYIVDRANRIYYKGGQGPYDFKPDAARAALIDLLENESHIVQ